MSGFGPIGDLPIAAIPGDGAITGTIAEAIVLSDGYSVAGDQQGTITETIALSDSYTNIAVLHDSISESITVSDVYAGSSARTATLTDALQIGDFYTKPIFGPPAEVVTEGWWHYFYAPYVTWIGYDPSNELLEVYFSDESSRTFSGVSFGIAQAFVTADDPDLYYENAIRTRYPRVFVS